MKWTCYTCAHVPLSLNFSKWKAFNYKTRRTRLVVEFLRNVGWNSQIQRSVGNSLRIIYAIIWRHNCQRKHKKYHEQDTSTIHRVAWLAYEMEISHSQLPLLYVSYYHCKRFEHDICIVTVSDEQSEMIGNFIEVLPRHKQKTSTILECITQWRQKEARKFWFEGIHTEEEGNQRKMKKVSRSTMSIETVTMFFKE